MSRAWNWAQLYNVVGKLNGEPAAILAIYQVPELKRAR